MNEIAKENLIRLLKTKGFDPKASWFYITFKNKFEKEYNIYKMSLEEAYKNLVDFLRDKKIDEVLFFPEPEFDAKKYFQAEMPNAFVKVEELEKFLKKHVNTFTNCHVADKELKWIFTITHHEDFFISGTNKFAAEFIKFFKGATIESREEIDAKWKNKD